MGDAPRVGAAGTGRARSPRDRLCCRRFRFGPVELLAPCRVVAVVEGGFTYGTLAGHPESGEESFVVHADGARTWLAIRSYSRLASVVARVGTPVSRRVQSRAVDRYAAALRSLLG